jgi:4-amino-4-deoxy-L-arabinose transferase-like glycosyltransferase
VHYQHYRVTSESLGRAGPLVLAALIAQTLVVVIALARLWPAVRVWVARHLRWWQLAGIALVFGLGSAALSRDLRVYATELAFATFLQTLNLGTIILAVAALPTGALAWLERSVTSVLGHFGAGADGEPGGLDRFALAAAAWVALVAAALSALAYGRHPHVPDEVGYILHARYFAQGMIALPAPPVPAAFDVDLMTFEPERWYSPVPPGWPAVLAVGARLGAAWLVNPVLAGLNVLLTYLVVRELYPRRTARAAVLLLCVSPWYLFMGMNFMTHMLALACALAAALSVARSRRDGRLGRLLLGGLAIGVVSLIRPLEGLAVAGLLGLWALGIRGRPVRIAPAFALALGATLTGALTLPYNRALTGEARTFPIMAYFDRYYGAGSNDLGFGPIRGVGWTGLDPFPGHGLRDVLVNANLNAFSVNVELLGWSTGSLILIALVVFSRGLRRPDSLMLVAIAGVVAIHSFYYFSGGPDFGARYWWLIIVPCVVLTVRGMEVLAAWLLPRDVRSAEHPGRRAVAAVGALGLMAVINYVPWRAVDKYHHYRNMRPELRALARTNDFGRGIVLVRGRRHPDYASAAVYNPLDLRANAPIYVWDRSPEVRARVLEAYPDRPVWLVDGPSVTGRGFRVVAGPLSVEQAR